MLAAAACAVSTATFAACSDTAEQATSASSISAVASLPDDLSVEAGFARDMSVHHAQAVAMAELIRDRTDDPPLRLLATDIALTQQAQIGRMSGWLDEWGVDQTSTRPAMTWIRPDNVLAAATATPPETSDMAGMPGMTEMTGMTETTGVPEVTGMPGMATRPEVSALGTLPVGQAEVAFLRLMIAHHRAGVDMASAALARTDRGDVVRLATSIVSGQQNEIDVMTALLADRGQTP